jgi:sec-independent protein translocase protein TatA
LFGFIPSIGPWELVAILIIVLMVFGPGKLPSVGKALGNSIREFRNATSTSTEQEKETADNDIA